MYVDVRACPSNKSLAEHIAEKIAVYVRVAEFVDHKGRTFFRMLIDTELSAKQLKEVLNLEVIRWSQNYKLNVMETVVAPVVDHEKAPHQKTETTYLRVTYTV
jgi:hypothetical protein